MDLKDLLFELSQKSAVSGNEDMLMPYLKELFSKHCDEVITDKFYNVLGIKKGFGKNPKKIMVSAHYDEIGFLVKSIDEKGFIKIANIGGIDSKILLAQEVMIHGKKDVYGILGAKPPHLINPEEAKKAPKLSELIIDVGMSCEKVKELISLGDPITFKTYPFELKGNKISTKSMDNRCSVAVLIKAMEEMDKLKFENDIYFVASTQEEVGLRGAIVFAYSLEPDIAIVVDGCMGDHVDASKDETYMLGKGPAIAVGPNLHKKMGKKIMDVAKVENINYQIDTEPDNTGTEAWAIQVSKSGVPVALISIPLRYMHTTIETIHLDDVRNSARLIARFCALPSSEMEGLLCC